MARPPSHTRAATVASATAAITAGTVSASAPASPPTATETVCKPTVAASDRTTASTLAFSATPVAAALAFRRRRFPVSGAGASAYGSPDALPATPFSPPRAVFLIRRTRRIAPTNLGPCTETASAAPHLPKAPKSYRCGAITAIRPTHPASGPPTRCPG